MFKNKVNKSSKLVIAIASIYSIFYATQAILVASNSSGLGGTPTLVPAQTTEIWWANFCERLFRAEIPNKVEGPLNLYLTQYGNQSGLTEEKKALLKYYKERWDSVKAIVDRVREKSKANGALTRYERGVGTLITQMRNHFNPASSSNSSASQPPQTQSSSAGATSASTSSSSSSNQTTQNQSSGLKLPHTFRQGREEFTLSYSDNTGTPSYFSANRNFPFHVTIPKNQRGGDLGYTFHVTNKFKPKYKKYSRYHYSNGILKWGTSDTTINKNVPKNPPVDSDHSIARAFLEVLLAANK
ncbi:MAG: hypothetical protein BGO77_06015 [Caedibacter sp. 37-49]|nr:MAG: hypothetical protein BGO77_06015 [Caedibacter sp. 37-49]